MIALSVLWAHLRKHLTTLRVAVAFVGAICLAAVILLLRRRGDAPGAAPEAPHPMDEAIRRADEAISEANARAAVTIAAARGQDAEVQRQVTAVLADPDGPRRRRALIELRQRLEGGQP